MRCFQSATSPLASAAPCSTAVIASGSFLSDAGKFSSSHARASARKASRSAPPKSAISIVLPMRSAVLRRVGQAQDALGDDVRLDLLAAAEDRRGLAREPGP